MSLANIEVIGSDGCPYVQRVVSVLIEKNIPFSYLNVDLKNKPAWFLEKSPLGKVPVVRFPDGKIVFESLVLLELIEDIHPGLTPADPVVKAHNKAWTEYGGSIFQDLFGALAKPTKEEHEAAINGIPKKFEQLEKEIKGPFFNGDKVAVIDFALAPFAQRLHAFISLLGHDLTLSKFPKVKAYLEKIADLSSTRNALIYQTQKDPSLDSLNNIKGLHDAQLDPSLVTSKLSSYRSHVKELFPKSYVSTVILA